MSAPKCRSSHALPQVVLVCNPEVSTIYHIEANSGCLVKEHMQFYNFNKWLLLLYCALLHYYAISIKTRISIISEKIMGIWKYLPVT